MKGGKNMEKAIFSIGLCLTLLLSGCAPKSGIPSEPTSTPPTNQTSDLSRSGADTVPHTEVQLVDWSKVVQGKIMGMYPAGGSKVLIFADQMTLYDLAAGKAVATTSKEALDMVRCQTLDSGYVIAGEATAKNSGGGLGLAGGSSGPQFRVIFYNASLKDRSELDLSKLLKDDEALISTEWLAFSSDGNRIAYATMTGLYLYDRQSDKRTTLIDLTPEDNKARSGISVVEQVGFTNDGKSIAFKAQSFDVPAITGKPSFDTIGTINTDGSGLTNQKVDGYSAKELSAYDSKLLLAEDFRTADGRIMVRDIKNGGKKIYDLTDKKEGGNICGSDTGHYFASSVSNKTGWTVRVYDTETGKSVKEQSISNDGQKAYGINDPIIRVLDGAKVCFVLLGARQDAVHTKVAMFLF